MISFPAWVDEAIKRWFYDLDKTIHQHDRVINYRREEKDNFHKLKNGLDENQQALLMQWEEKEAYCTGIEKELLYRQGLTDGAQLILALLHADVPLSFEQPPAE